MGNNITYQNMKYLEINITKYVLDQCTTDGKFQKPK